MVAQALTSVYNDLKKNGRTTETSPLFSFAEFNELIGFPDVWDFDKRYAP